MTAAEIVRQLRPLAAEPYRKTLLRHGAKDPVLGVKIEHLNKIRKQVGRDHRLALELFDTGIYDAQYLAGLVAEPSKMTRADLRRWVETSNCPALCDGTVACVAAQSPHGRELALEWIESKDPTTAAAGWTALSFLGAFRKDEAMAAADWERLLKRVARTIHDQPDGVRYTMNGFVIAAGSYVPGMTDRALEVAEQVGKVTVDMGDTACKVPYAPDYIRKVLARRKVVKKRKPARA